jgi:SNF2 family DNA or RNA helicase
VRSASDLRPYQQRIATHLYEHDEALCVLRPGGGKTAAALTAIVDLLREGIIRHALVIAPKRVARVVWPDAVAEWAHTQHLTYAVLDGSPAERMIKLSKARERDLTIVGLDVVPWLVEMLDNHSPDHPLFDLLVIDEISRLRNPKSVRAKKLSMIGMRWRLIWGLSGTLRPNSALDLFMPVRVVTRGKLWGRSFYQWRKDRFFPTDFQGYKWAPFPEAEALINEQLAPLTIMVPEDEIPKVTPTIVFDKVELPPAARREYDRMQELLIAKVDDGKDTVVAGSAAIATGKLAQLANGFIYGESEEHGVGPTNWMHEAKREWLADLIEETSEPTLIIYEYQADLWSLRETLKDAGEELRYLGAGVTDKKAAANIEDWNAGRLRFMGLHPASGGHGLNLQFGGADMCWISPTWSPELWEQTIARIARPGQTRPVVVRICVARNTVDELKLDRVHYKMSAQEAFEAWMREWHARKAAEAA